MLEGLNIFEFLDPFSRIFVHISFIFTLKTVSYKSILIIKKEENLVNLI